MTDGSKILTEMNERSREVFRRVVEGYLASGDPVGSRTLTRSMTERLSTSRRPMSVLLPSSTEPQVMKRSALCVSTLKSF